MSDPTGQVSQPKLLQGAAPQPDEGPCDDGVSKAGVEVPPGLRAADEREALGEAHVAPLPEALRRMSFTMWCALQSGGGDVSPDAAVRAEARRGSYGRFGRAVAFQARR